MISLPTIPLVSTKNRVCEVRSNTKLYNAVMNLFEMNNDRGYYHSSIQTPSTLKCR